MTRRCLDEAAAERIQSNENTGNNVCLGGVEVGALIDELLTIREEMIAATAESPSRLEDIHPTYRESAGNLLHYLALRRRDIRPLQVQLASLGLSSLGRAESHALATVDSVLRVLHDLVRRPWRPSFECPKAVDFMDGQRLLAMHTEQLLGPATNGRDVRVMVTMPSEASTNFTLVYDLLRGGMECMRINCAHDDPAVWMRMIEHLNRAKKILGRPCQIVMDLAGPKLRTGPLEPGPAVIAIRPRRDVYGRVLAPARVWLTNEDSPQPSPSPADACLPLSALWVERLRAGEQVKFTDARGAKRTITIVDVASGGCWAEAIKTAYIIPGTVLCHGVDAADREHLVAPVGDIPPPENAIHLEKGDLLILTRNLAPGRAATFDSSGDVLSPASIGCTIPEVFDDVLAGESIWFDDGKIGGIVERVERDCVFVHITQTRLQGEKLRSDKGINLPDSRLRLAALTAKDIEDLQFAVRYADVIEISFANSVQDVASLQEHIAAIGGRQPAIVLKIETQRGFENLPAMLLAAMRTPCCGVMIARGDLAVESGFERLAEIQEEILWVCEAAHVPVIWATQVLENLAKEGMPSRAEVTDAAMAHRAECVMLNKGPHVVEAVKALDDILHRMQNHQAKKSAMLRELQLAHTLPTFALP